MKIVNDALTASYRHPGKCSWCGERVRMLCGAHIFAKGHGGGRQIDAPFNLVALGADAVFDCSCHVRHHAGQRPKHCDLLAVAAAQNKCHQRDIEQLVYLIRRLDRDTTREQLFAAIDRECRPTARELARRTLT